MTIKKHIRELQDQCKELSCHSTSGDEFIACEEVSKAINILELRIYDAQKAFERRDHTEAVDEVDDEI